MLQDHYILKYLFRHRMVFLLVLFSFLYAKPADNIEGRFALMPLHTESVAARPVRNEHYLSPNGLFLIHYDNSGTHAVPQNFTFDPLIPDYVYSAARYLEESYYVLRDSLGFRSPPIDNSTSPEIDIYFKRSDMYYGQTFFDQEVEPGVWTSYIELNSNLENASVFYTTGLQGLMVTCAHELFHVFQLGYKYRNSDVFYFEMSSVWFEEYMYPEINDYHSYFTDYITRWNYAINHSSLYYNNVGFNFYIDAHYSLPENNVILAVWEQMIGQNALNAIRYVLTDRGSSFENALSNWGTAQVLCSPYASDDFPYSFNDAEVLQTISFSQYPDHLLTDRSATISLSASPMVSYYRINNMPNSLLSFEAVFPENTYANLICLDNAQSRVYPAGNGPVFIDGNRYSDFVLCVGTDRANTSGTYAFSVIESNIISSLYPNPATEGQTCYIEYILTRDHEAGNMVLYDLLGRKIFSRPLKASELSAGAHQLSFPALTYPLSSGLYIVMLQTEDTRLTKKMTFFK